MTRENVYVYLNNLQHYLEGYLSVIKIIMRPFLILLLTLFSIGASSQEDSTKAQKDTLAPYEKSNAIPTFSLQLPDSSWFFNTSLKEKKPTLIFYFSPDCGHCQLETDALITNINKLKNLQIVMVTSRPFDDMNKFATHYKIHKFPTIVIGRDPAYYITRFYQVKFTPFAALYNKKGKLEKIYKKGIDMDEMIKLVN